MKLRYLFILPLIATALVGCDDIEESTGQPVVNPQLPEVTASDFTVTLSSTLTNTIDLPALVEQADQNGVEYDEVILPLFTITVDPSDLPYGYAIDGDLQLKSDNAATPSKYYDVATVSTTSSTDEAGNITGVSVSTTLSALMNAWNTMMGFSDDTYPVSFRALVDVNAEGGIFGYIFDNFSAINMVGVITGFPYLYNPGDANNWFGDGYQVLWTWDYQKYSGFGTLKNYFKFTSEPNWDNYIYGVAPETEIVWDEEKGMYSGSLGLQIPNDPVYGDLPGMQVSDDLNLYWINANIVDLNWDATLINSISLIGGFNGWGADEELTPSSDLLVWTGQFTITTDADGGNEWKFRMNNSWDYSLGGDLNDLVYNGNNITSDPGTYNVTLDLSQRPYTCTLDLVQ